MKRFLWSKTIAIFMVAMQICSATDNIKNNELNDLLIDPLRHVRVNILKNVNSCDLINLVQVSKKFSEIMQDNELWRHYCEIAHFISNNTTYDPLKDFRKVYASINLIEPTIKFYDLPLKYLTDNDDVAYIYPDGSKIILNMIIDIDEFENIPQSSLANFICENNRYDLAGYIHILGIDPDHKNMETGCSISGTYNLIKNLHQFRTTNPDYDIEVKSISLDQLTICGYVTNTKEDIKIPYGSTRKTLDEKFQVDSSSFLKIDPIDQINLQKSMCKKLSVTSDGTCINGIFDFSKVIDGITIVDYESLIAIRWQKNAALQKFINLGARSPEEEMDIAHYLVDLYSEDEQIERGKFVETSFITVPKPNIEYKILTFHKHGTLPITYFGIAKLSHERSDQARLYRAIMPPTGKRF